MDDTLYPETQLSVETHELLDCLFTLEEILRDLMNQTRTMTSLLQPKNQ